MEQEPLSSAVSSVNPSLIDPLPSIESRQNDPSFEPEDNGGTSPVENDESGRGEQEVQDEQQARSPVLAQPSQTAYSLDIPELRKRGAPLREQFNCKRIFSACFFFKWDLLSSIL